MRPLGRFCKTGPHFDLTWLKWVAMLATIAFLLVVPHRATIEQLDEWATKRDLASLESVASSEAKPHLAFIRRPGPYGGGRFGWHAFALAAPSGGAQYVVFSSPMTCEDYGDFVFTMKDGQIEKYVPEADVLGVRAVHEDIDLRFEPEKKEAHIVADVKLRKTGPTGPSYFLRLSPNYRVANATEDGKVLPFAQAGGVVCLPTPRDSQATVKLAYDAVVDQRGFAGAIRDDEVMLSEDYWWPHTGRQPVSQTTTAHVPKDWVVIAQGEPASETVQGDEKTVVTRMDVPVSYLSFSAGKLKVAKRKVDGIEFFVASKRMTDEQMQMQLDLMPDVTKAHSRYGRYPFSRWGAVVTDLYVGGALEAYSFATYQVGWLPDDDQHEPAHTWFGGLLSNTYLRSFWNESFANYCDGRASRRFPVGDNQERERAFLDHPNPGRDWNDGTCEDSGVESGAMGSSLGYGKGAFVLQQLELEMGGDKMDTALANWVASRKPGEAAEWQDFERSVGPDWKWFFNQWLARPGWPALNFSNVRFENGRIMGDYEFNGDPYRLKLEVWVEDANGGHLETVDVDKEGNQKKGTVAWTAKSKPTLVVFDPYRRTLPGRPTGETAPLAFARTDGFKKVVDSNHKDWASPGLPETVPSEIDRVTLIGHPDTMQALKPVLAKAGVRVDGQRITYMGSSFSLKDAAVVGVVEMDGKRIGFQVGSTRRQPKIGDAAVAVVDKLGRFLKGETPPMRKGPNAFDVR